MLQSHAFLAAGNPLRCREPDGTTGIGKGTLMKGWVCGLGIAAALILLSGIPETALAQKAGGVLRVYHRDSPASMSIHEEGTNSTEIPMMGVFNNLVMYDQHVAQNSLSTIVPDLATDWSTSEDGKQLTFHLRQSVKWHD